MSNYLNNLVARQLEPASLVRPRLPSLFEPPAYPGTLLHGQSESVAPLNVEIVELVNEVNAPSETRRSNETRVNTPSPSPLAANDEIPNTVWRGQQRIASSSKQSPESTSDRTGEDSPQVAATHIQAPPSTPTATRTDAASATPSPSAAPEETAPPRQNVDRPSPPLTASFERQDRASEQIVSPRLKPSTIDAVRVDSTKKGIESTKNSIESTKNSIVFQPRVAALVESQRERDDHSPPLQSPASEQPPVINVTIGRIEVRAAVASNAPRRPEPSAKPMLSLDEYLRRRAKGGGA